MSCSSGSGILTVSFTPLTSIGTFTVDEDEAYAGRYAAGAAPTTRSLAITFRKVSTGARVSCNAAALRTANSSLQLWVRGTRVSTPTTVPTPPTPTTTRPPASQPTTSPSQTTQPPTITPPTIPPDDTDPADSDPPTIG